MSRSPRIESRSAVVAESSRRRGIVLILVLIVVVALAFSAYTFTAIMQAEQEAAQMSGRRIQSRYLVDSGVESIRLFLSLTDDGVEENGGTYDNPVQFQGMPVYQDPVEQINGYVTAEIGRAHV